MIKGVGLKRGMRKIICGALAAVMLCTSVDVRVFGANESVLDEGAADSIIAEELIEQTSPDEDINGENLIEKIPINNDLSEEYPDSDNDDALIENDGDENENLFAGGSGTVDDPYLISNVSQMQKIGTTNASKSYLAGGKAWYKLIVDLTLDDWQPVYHSEGHFDGDGHTIYNLKIAGYPDAGALFGSIGSISNLTIENADISGKLRTAVFALTAKEVNNCCLKGNVLIRMNEGSLTNAMSVGGFCENVSGIENCTNYARITVKNEGDIGRLLEFGGFAVNAGYAKNLVNKEGSSIICDGRVGGICKRGGTIENCINYADIYTTDNEGAGNSGDLRDAAGIGFYCGSCSIVNCLNYGNINAAGNDAAGIVKSVWGKAVIKKCSNAGTITAHKYKGIEPKATGIAETVEDGSTIEGCYNLGTINGFTVAGILSENVGQVCISGCYNKGELITTYEGNCMGEVGGIVWKLNSGKKMSVIENCYNSGEITLDGPGSIQAGGIAGVLSVGGYTDDTELDDTLIKIENCYNNFSFKNFSKNTDNHTAGIVARTWECKNGDNFRIATENCYCLDKGYLLVEYLDWDRLDEYKTKVFAGIKQCTDAQLRKQATYQGFDFDSVWAMGEDDYPYPILVGSGGKNSYTISFDPNGGTVSKREMTTNNNGIISSFPRPFYAGKRFMGWYTAAEGGERVSREYVFGADTTVYAHWGEYNEEDRVEIIPVNPAADAKGVRYLDDGNFIKLSISFETKSPIKSVDPSAGSFRIINKKTGKAIYETGANNASLFHVSSRDGVSTVEYTHYSGFEASTEYYVEIESGFLVFENENLYAFTDKDDWCFRTANELKKIELPNDGSKMIEFNPDAFSKPSSEYIPELSELAVCLSCMVYENSVKDEDEEHKRIAVQFKKLGFDTNSDSNSFIKNHYYEDPTAESMDTAEQGSYSPSWIVHKTINTDGEDIDLVCVVIRGTYKCEWIDNFDPGIKMTHEGFEHAADHIKEISDEYIRDNINSGNKVKILITGHSRGAAVANILGKKYDDTADDADRNDIYVYTYATPNVTKSVTANDRKYSNIFNIINPEDFVTKVLPRKWNYRRYGINYVLPSKSIYPRGFSKYTSYDEFVNDVIEKTKIYIGSKAMGEAKKYRVYDPYDLGMKSIEFYVNILTTSVDSIEKYYLKSLGSEDEMLKSRKTGMEYSISSLYTLFKLSLAYYMAGDRTEEEGLYNLTCAAAIWGIVGAETTAFFAWNGKLTPQFGSAHTAETYMAMLDLVPVDTLKKPKYYNEVRVSCPVDVTVRDKDGNIIGQVTDNNITKTTNELAMEVEGDSKSFFVHDGADYKIELVGNDTGTMDYTIIKYDADAGEIERVVYQDVPLEKGTTYTQDLKGYDNAEEAPLFDEKSQVVKKSLELTEDDLGKLSVSVNVVGNGHATSYESVTPGDHIMLSASPEIGNEFDGWYDKDGNLISSDSKYGLSVKKSEEFTAKFKELNGIVVSPIDPQTYTGIALTPDIELYDGTQLLTPGTDYTITYKNNKNAYTFEDADKLTDAQKKKAPQAIIKMKGNYSGQEVVYFCINPLSIDDEAAFEASVKKGKQTVIFKYNDKALKEKTDYTVDSVTDAAVTVTGKGNFTGTHEFTLAVTEGITNVSMSKVTVEAIPTQFYTGTALTAGTFKGSDGSSPYAIKVSYPKGTELTAGKDYVVKRIDNSVNVGTATVVLKGLKAGGTAGASDKYSFIGEKRIKVKIAPRLADSAVVTGSDGSENLSAVYSKAGAKPENLTVTVEGRTLKEGRDYTVKYSGNTKYSGTGDKSDSDGKLTVAGKGNYKGSKSFMFKITRRPFTENSGINVNVADMPYSDKAGKFMSGVKVYDSEGKLLKAGTDYEKEIRYEAADGTELNKTSTPGEGDVITVKVTGKGGYTNDTISATYKILKAGEVNDISKAKISIDPVAYRSGKVILTGDDASHVHASIGKDKKILTFSTDGVDGDFMVLPGSYENNDKKGTAKVTFVGINNYSGSKTVTVKIGARSLLDWWKGLFM